MLPMCLMRPSVVWAPTQSYRALRSLVWTASMSDRRHGLRVLSRGSFSSLLLSSSPGHVRSTHRVGRRVTNAAPRSRGGQMRRDVSLPCRDVVMVWVELRLVSVGGHGGSRLCGCGQGTLMRDRPRAPFHPCLGTVPGATVAQRDRPRSRTCLDREGGQRPPSFGSAGPAVLPAPLCLRATRAPHRIGRHRTHPRVDTMASVYGHTGPCTGRASDGMIHGGHRPEEVGGG